MTRTLAAAFLLLATTAAACVVKPPVTYAPASGGPELELPDVKVALVSREAALAAAGPGRRFSIPLAPGADPDTRVADFLARADRTGADLMSDFAIYQQATRDGAAVECRSEILPETITQSRWKPPHDEQVSVATPVTRTVTDHEYRCHATTRTETRSYTEYERECHSVSRPVIRTRAGFGSGIETYTEYEQEEVCDSRPVTHYRTETVPDQDCGTEPVTHTVTDYEQETETRHVPGRTELLSRDRLRALAPICYAAPAAPLGNRLEAMLYDQRD